MTCDRESTRDLEREESGAVASHSAELVRGDSSARVKAPSSGLSGHLLPKGRRAAARCATKAHGLRAAFTSSSGNRYLAPSSYFQPFMAPFLSLSVVSPTQAPSVDW